MSKLIIILTLLILVVFPVHASTDVMDIKLKGLQNSPAGNQAELFSLGRVSSFLTDWGLTMAPDLSEIYYTVNTKKKALILVMKWESNHWSNPEVASFSGEHKDACPNFSSDGKKIIFLSKRPLSPMDKVKDYNFWCTERINDSWSKPYPLTDINSDYNESFPFWAKSGDLYFSMKLPGKETKSRIYSAKFKNGKFLKPTQVKGKVNTALGEYCPFVSPDGNYMILELLNGPGGFGGGDMYISLKQKDGSWGEPKNLGKEVNSKGHDCYPILTPKGKELIFISSRQPDLKKKNGHYTYNQLLWEYGESKEPFDFYWVKTDFLNRFIKN